MPLAVLKRSHEIYTNSFVRNSTIDNLYKPEIRSYNTPDQALDKQLGEFQDEMSASDFAVIGNRNQRTDELTNQNYDRIQCTSLR
jgi:hypothetical protein